MSPGGIDLEVVAMASSLESDRFEPLPRSTR